MAIKKTGQRLPPLLNEEQKKYNEMVEGIASNIMLLTKAVQSLLNGPLKRKALVVLLASSSRESQSVVDRVLLALEALGTDWLNK